MVAVSVPGPIAGLYNVLSEVVDPRRASAPHAVTVTGCKEQTMTHTATQRPPQPPPALATVADVMRPPLTTADTNDHVAAAAYLMKHARATALMVLDAQTGQPKGILTEADIADAVADGKSLNQLRIRELMTLRPTVINPATSIRDAAQIMTRSHFRHLPVCGDSGLAGIIDITDICRALLALVDAEREERKLS